MKHISFKQISVRQAALKKMVLSCAFMAMAMPVLAALKVGESAPLFKTQASLAGKAFEYSLEEHLKKGFVVVYFYPSAYTGGCNIQAHEFAVNMDKFAKAGASVVGVSMDSIERLNDFSADPQYCAGKLPVASDADGSIAKSYELSTRGIPSMKDTRGEEIKHEFTERTTFVIAPNGKIAATIGGVSPADNVQQTLTAVQKLIRAK